MIVECSTKKVKLSIIIISYNTRQVTEGCLKSIYCADWREPFEIIVVDNNSDDGSVEMIKAEFPEVRLIENDENCLFAIANNQGAAIAQGQYLLLLNSDTIVWGDNLQRTVDFFDHLPHNVACVGPRILNEDGTIQSMGYPNYSKRWMFVKHFWIDKILPSWFVENVFRIRGIPCDKNRDVGVVLGCCMMIRSDLYRQMGGLNENIEFYGEEIEFGYRCYHKYHFRTYYYKDAEIVHLGGRSTPKKVDESVSLRRYAKLINETVKTNDAIKICRITIAAAWMKSLVSSNKTVFMDIINHEQKIIDYLKHQNK